MKITLDMANLTIGDMEDFEDIAGAPMSTMADYRVTDEETGEATAVGMPIKFMTALVFIGMRQDDPRVKVADVRKMKIHEVEFDIINDEDTDATPLDESA